MSKPALILTIALALTALAAPVAQGAEKPRVAKTVATASGAGAVATATATCPAKGGSKGKWQALSGGFVLATPVDGVVFESRRVGQRSWRASAQSLSGVVTVTAYANCRRGLPKPRAISATVSTPGAAQVGPATTAQCPSGRAVSGGFATPPPYTALGAANTVIGSFPSGTRAWRVQVVSNQASNLDAFAYCAKRKRKPKIARAVADPGSVATDAGSVAVSSTRRCPAGQFAPGGGGFQQQNVTPTQYLVPIRSSQRPTTPASTKPLPPGYYGNVWQAHGLKVGSGTPVTMLAVGLCG